MDITQSSNPEPAARHAAEHSTIPCAPGRRPCLSIFGCLEAAEDGSLWCARHHAVRALRPRVPSFTEVHNG